MLTKEQLTALASLEAPPAVSIYLPTHEKAREVRQDPIRFKNAVAAVTQKLVEAGHRRPEVDELLDGAHRLLADEFFWRHQRRGLAVFAAPGLFQVHKLPIEVAEAQIVAPRPYVKPLLPLLADDGRYFVLAAHAGDTRLYAGSRFGLAEVEVDLPRSVAEIAAETDYQNTQHTAPAARPNVAAAIGMPAAHNFGDTPEEMRKVQLIEHLRRVANALEQHLNGTSAPIVLVAPPEIHGHLKALAKGIAFHDDGLPMDPVAMDEAELHARTYELVRPLFAQRRADDLDRFRMLAGADDPRASLALADVVSAARFQRVDTLFVQEGASVWGRHDPDEDRVLIEEESSPENEDLIDYAAVHTLVNGGNVHVLPLLEMPRDAPMVAIFRY